MTSINEIRTSIDTKLNKWEAQATALQVQFELSKEQAILRVEEQKQRFEHIAQLVKEKISVAQGQSAETKLKIQASFEQLQLQLALGGMDSRDAYQDWKHKAQKSIVAFEAVIELATAQDDAELDSLVEAYVKEADALDAEIEAIQAQFETDKVQAKADFKKNKQAVQSKIDAYKGELDQRRRVAADKLDAFDAELSAGASKIKDAFSNLFS